MRRAGARLAGALLLFAAYAPGFTLLDRPATGPAGAATIDAANAAWQTGLYGTLLVVGLAYVLSLVVPTSWATTLVTRVADALNAVPIGRVAVFSGAMCSTLAASVAFWAFEASPTSVDGMVQLAHAQALTAGSLALPTPGDPSAWMLQNGVLVDGGWVSVYPPVHVMLLALGSLVGAAWLVGPIAVGVGTAAFTLGFDAHRPGLTSRLVGLALALSPFWVFLGATHLSHATTAAFLALLYWSLSRAVEGRTSAWLLAGAFFGAAVATRAWVGLVAGSAIVLATWWPVSTGPAAGQRSAAVRFVAGGLPFALLLLGWNAILFGHPLRLGYSAAFGPAHGLGLHTDPWGNSYDALAALGYTSADLLQLGTGLFESPLPVLALIGAALVFARRPLVSGPITAWAVAGLIANAAYWHHGVHFGPRMLLESAPAWAALTVISAAALLDRLLDMPKARSTTAWVIALAFLGGAASVPALIGARAATDYRVELPTPESMSDEGAIVFVHGSWASRLVANLSSTGMRRDSIETLIRRNDICQADRYVRSVRATATAAPAVDFTPLPGTPPELFSEELSPGNTVRVARGVRFDDPVCARNARSDRLGILDLELVAWRGPATAGSDVWYARDLGPEANRIVLSQTDREAWVYIAGVDDAGHLVSYDVGMELLWRGAAGAPAPSAGPLQAP